MKKEAIHALLPHREPMLLIDEAEIMPDGKAVGKAHVCGKEFYLQGHFPGQPVVPGVILCEMMAQTCCTLLRWNPSLGTPYFTGIKNASFKRKVVPGETVTFVCEIIRTMRNFFLARGEGRVAGDLCVTADFSFALIREE